MSTRSFYFPLLFLKPEEDLTISRRSPFTLARRRRQTSIFDLATLGTRHQLHLPYQLMDVTLSACHVELAVEAGSLDDATESLKAFMLGLYLSGVSPTLAPFATTHSVNDYSGINSRDSETLRAKMPTEMQEGLTSDAATVEAWPVHVSLHCLVNERTTNVSDWRFQQAASKAAKWLSIESSHSALRAMRDAAQAAPTLPSHDQALLHVWCALESLFPKVSSEVSFRLALYLSQLIEPQGDRAAYFDRVRDAYSLRSRVAHGSASRISPGQWADSWHILIDAGNAILQRGRLPSEDDLLRELFSRLVPPASSEPQPQAGPHQ